MSVVVVAIRSPVVVVVQVDTVVIVATAVVVAIITRRTDLAVQAREFGGARVRCARRVLVGRAGGARGLVPPTVCRPRGGVGGCL